jgi:hypothetical protein
MAMPAANHFPAASSSSQKSLISSLSRLFVLTGIVNPLRLWDDRARRNNSAGDCGSGCKSNLPSTVG